jgi:hypothetical protein
MLDALLVFCSDYITHRSRRMTTLQEVVKALFRVFDDEVYHSLSDDVSKVASMLKQSIVA